MKLSPIVSIGLNLAMGGGEMYKWTTHMVKHKCVLYLQFQVSMGDDLEWNPMGTRTCLYTVAPNGLAFDLHRIAQYFD